MISNLTIPNTKKRGTKHEKRFTFIELLVLLQFPRIYLNGFK